MPSTARRWIGHAHSWLSTVSRRRPRRITSTSSRRRSFIRHLIPFAAYYEPAKFDAAPGRDLHRHAALVAGDDAGAQPGLDQQHVRPRGVPRSPPPAERGDHQSEPGAPVLRRARVQRGLGVLLRADDEGATGSTTRRRAGTSCTPMPSGVRPASSSTSSSIAGSSASTTLSSAWSPRPASSVPAALAEVKRYTSTPTYQLSYLFGRHMIEKLKAEVQAARGDGLRRSAIPRHAALRRDHAGQLCPSPVRGEATDEGPARAAGRTHLLARAGRMRQPIRHPPRARPAQPIRRHRSPPRPRWKAPSLPP